MTDLFLQLRKELNSRRRLSISEDEQKFHKALLAGTFDRPLKRIGRRRKQGIQPVKPGTPFHAWKTINAAHAVLGVAGL